MPESTVKSKLVVKDLGNPRVAAGFSAEDATKGRRHFLGTIGGIAEKIKVKTDAKGQMFEAIVGNFEGVSGETGEITQSGMLYLPGGIHEMIAEPLKKDNAASIEFGIAVYTVKADNPIGYSYAVVPLHKPEAADPLAPIREKLAAARTKLLPKPKEKVEEKVEEKKGPKAA